MPIRHAHWYSQNEGVSYPIDETATCVDDAGARLPSNIITDLYLRWPAIYGQYAFLSSLSVTPSLVTLTIQVTSDLDDTTQFVPLAVLTVPRPVAQGRQFALLPQLNGVGGWVVFGAGTGEVEPYRGRFSQPRQALLTARAAKAYRTPPVTSLRAYNAAEALTGVIRLSVLEPLAIAQESREINGVLRDCIVVRLTAGDGADAYPVPEEATRLISAANTNLFREFSGPCAGRPESRSCGDPQPIEFINAVGADCDGRITLEFQGCAHVGQIQDICGIVVDCGLGLVDACVPPQIPDSEGFLPSERDPVNIPTPDDPPPDPPPAAISESVSVIGSLPYVDCFDNGVINYFDIFSGMWDTADDISDEWSPCYVSVSSSDSASASNSHSSLSNTSYITATTATRNITLWKAFDVSTLGRRFITHFKLNSGPSGVRHNAGIVLNLRPHATNAGQYVYYLAEVDYDLQEIRISRFNGTTFQTAVALSQPGLALGQWYRMEVRTAPHGVTSNRVQITLLLRSLENDIVQVAIGPLIVNNYLPSSGYFGLHTNRALASFSNIQVKENNG
jgi:hypothetical protein